jgi:hypothetical protein
MPTTLYLHIGTWKTGSSTIQHNLYKQRGELKKEGFFYLCKEDKMVVSDGKMRHFTSLENEFIRKSRKKLSAILERHQGKEYTYISSAEEYSGSPFMGFKNAGAVAKNLNEIMKGFDLDAKVIVYLRRQDRFFESLYQQSIRLGESHSFEEFYEQFDETDFNWLYLLDSYSEVFGKQNVIVRRYHPKYLPEENSLIRDFGRVIGSRMLSEFSTTQSKNKGYSRDTLEITRIMNKYFEGEERYQLRKLFDRIGFKNPLEGYTFFTKSAREQFLERYKDQNRQIAASYLNEEGDLFPDHPNEEIGLEPYEGLTTEALVANFSKALLLIRKDEKRELQKMEADLKSKMFLMRIRNLLAKALDKRPIIKKRLKSILERSKSANK